MDRCRLLKRVKFRKKIHISPRIKAWQTGTYNFKGLRRILKTPKFFYVMFTVHLSYKLFTVIGSKQHTHPDNSKLEETMIVFFSY
jgi:hypothetical protein